MRYYVYILMLAATAASAQRPTVRAQLAPDSVAIGDRFTLDVVVERDIMQSVDFPNFEGGHLTPEIEIVEEGAVDTLSRQGRKLRLHKSYTLTTFDEGTHSLGRFPTLYADKNIVDTLFSNDSLVLRVGSFAIDTTTMTLREIKPVQKMPFKPGEISLWVAGGAWALAIVGVVGYALWQRWRRRKRGEKPEEPATPDSPHLAAIKALETLNAQKLWQNNKHKLYYTRLTDILRRYFAQRWGVAAMEMTSDEIIEAATRQGVSGVPMTSLKNILRSSDLVKFAKHKPEAEENEMAYTLSYYFVEETKQVEEEVL